MQLRAKRSTFGYTVLSGAASLARCLGIGV